MSYILDALRKSEEQRRLASTPDLATEHRPTGNPRRDRARLLMLVGTGLLLNAGVVGAWLFWPWSSNLGDPGPTVAPAPAEPAGRTGPRDSSGRTDATTVTAGGTSQDPASAPGASDTVGSATAGASGSAASGTAGPEAKLTERSAERQADSPTIDGAQPATAPSQQSAEPPVSIRALPAGFRQRIGPLSFSTHIYADEPRFREVAINGRTHREGASVGALRLIEITEDGVILELEGRRFSVSVLQDWDY